MKFDSLGIFETSSVSSSLLALDAIQKEKLVKIFDKQILGEGIVTLFLKGDLGALKKAFNCGAEAIISTNEFRSSHIIPLPHQNLVKILEMER